MIDPSDCKRRPSGDWAVVAQRVGYPLVPVPFIAPGVPLGEWHAGKPKLFRASWASVNAQRVTDEPVSEDGSGGGFSGSSSFIRWTWEVGTGAREGVIVDSAGGSFVTPPTTTLNALLLGPGDGSWALLSENGTRRGVLPAGTPNTVEVATIWATAAYDHEAGAGPFDAPSFTERRALERGLQAFLRPPYARRVTTYGPTDVTWSWLDFTTPPTAGQTFPSRTQVSVPGFTSGVMAAFGETPGGLVVVWDLQV
jgi:hypothetical protein